MGKKRNRSTALAKPAVLPADGPAQHTQTLVETVRESRDAEFAAEKKQAARLKRRKLAEEQELAAAKKAAKAAKKAGRVDAKRAGLDVWRRAALRRKERQEGEESDEGEEESDEHMDKKISEKIYREAKEQRAEIRAETLREGAEGGAERSRELHEGLKGVGKARGEKSEGADSDSDSDDESAGDLRSKTGLEGGVEGIEELDFLDGTKITEEDEMALAIFSNMEAKLKGGGDREEAGAVEAAADEEGPPRLMLADIILDKIREKEEADARDAAIAADPERAERDRKIAEVYGLVGNILSRYRSGKVPKAFKVIHMMKNWESILYLTRPDGWSPAAVYVATRLLVSNLPAKQVVKFYTNILLPRCLEDISENKKLNYHLYRALGKAVYKPDAFNKGILFPVCEDRGCTLRHATIIGSVVTKVSIPMLHSAAALLYIVQLPYAPPNSIIITALLEKKYALPYRVLDAVVESFLKMKEDPRPLPLLWHKSLLAFAQRYKMELTMEQKEKLKFLMRLQTHHAVTPEIRRELFSARNRGDLMEPDANTIARNIQNAAMVM